MISAGENLLGRDADEPAQLAQHGALRIIDVAKPDVAGVSLEGEERHLLTRGLDERDDAVHLGFAFGHESDGPRVIPDGLGAGLALEETENAIKDGLRLGKKLVVGLGAALVPIAVGLPAAAVALVKEVALAGENEIGLDGDVEFIEAMDNVPEVAARVDGPEDACLAQPAQQRDQTGRDGGCSK